MKQLHITFLITMLMSMVGANAFSHDIAVANSDGNTIYYKYLSNNTELAVTYRGTSYNEYSNEYTGILNVPASVIYDGTTYTVTSINSEAFKGCTNLTNVSLPNSVNNIYFSAFSECPAVVNVDNDYYKSIGDGVYQINNGYNRLVFVNGNCTSFTVPSDISDVDNNSFIYATKLEKLVFEERDNGTDYGLSFRDKLNLENCPLKELYLGRNVSYDDGNHNLIGSGAFYGIKTLEKVTLGSKISYLGDRMFGNCTNLSTVIAEGTITYAGSFVFSGTPWVKSNAVQGVAYLGNYAVGYDGETKSISFKASTTGIARSFLSGKEGIKKVTLPAGIKNIPGLMFYYCKAEEVIIPSNVETISYNSFGYAQINKLYIESSENVLITYESHDDPFGAFDSSKIEFVSIGRPMQSKQNNGQNPEDRQYAHPFGSATVGEAVITKPIDISGLFEGCAIKKVTLPEGLTSIGNYAFRYQKAEEYANQYSYYGISGYQLTEIVIPSTVVSIGKEAFSGHNIQSIMIPASVESIGDYAFKGNSAKTLSLPSTLTVLGKGAFMNNSLSSLTLPNSITSIGEYTFSSNKLTNITLPNNLTNIGNYAFSYNQIETIDIPSSVTRIGVNAFGDNIKKVIVHDIAAWCMIQFGSNPLGTAHHLYSNENTEIIDLIIPNGVESLNEAVFSGCTEIKSVTIPGSVKEIKGKAFEGCSSLNKIIVEDIGSWCGVSLTNNSLATSSKLYVDADTPLHNLVIPDGVTSIGNYTFYNTEHLNVSIPASVSTIGEYAFNTVDVVTVNRSTPPTLSSYWNSFAGYNNNNLLIVPKGCRNAYVSNSYWNSEFKTIVEQGGSVVDSYGTKTILLETPGTLCDHLTTDDFFNLEGIKIIGDINAKDMVVLQKIGYDLQQYVGENNNEDPYGWELLSSIRSIDLSNCHIIGSQYNSSWDDERDYSYWPLLGECETKTDTISSDMFFFTAPGGEIKLPRATYIEKDAVHGASTVYIPSSVQYIHGRAFINPFSGGLPTIEIEEGSPFYVICESENGNQLYIAKEHELTMFLQEDYNVDLVLPSDYSIINDYCFNSLNLQSVVVPEGYTNIGENAFSDCCYLKSIQLPSTLRILGKEAMSGCSSLTSVSLPTGLTVIEDGTFSGCYKLSSVVISSGVTSIGDGAFSGCSSLTSVTIPSSVTSIGDYTFSNCSSITSLTIPTSVTSIGNQAFYNCSGLTSIQVSGTNNIYDSRNNCNAIIETKTNTLLYGCNNTIIPNNVTSIESKAFYNCSGLTSVTIPSSVTSIGDYAFFGCRNLKKVIIDDIAAWCKITFEDSYSNPLYYAHHLYTDQTTEITELTIPDAITSVGNYAFSGCTGLTSVTIPNSVTSIGYDAFNGCTNLTSVKVEMGTPVRISYSTFSNRKNATLYVPAGCKTAYEAADYWKEFKEIVEMKSFGDPTANTLNLSNVEGYKGRQVVLPIALTNQHEITGLQFDLYLPAGVTVATKSNSKMMIETTERMEGSYSISSNQIGDYVRIIGYSADGDAFTGNSGDILKVTLNIGENVADGDYTIRIKDIVLSDVNSTEYHPADAAGTLTVKSYMLGDVDDSGAVNINDVVCIINHILNKQVTTFIAEAADVDGSGTININDVVTLINRFILMKNNAPALTGTEIIHESSIADNYLHLADMEIAPGETREVQLLMTNANTVAGIQGNITLPAGLSFVTTSDGHVYVKSLYGCAEGFTLSCALQADGSLSFAQYSASGNTYSGTGGVFTFKVKASEDAAAGTYPVALSDVVMSVEGVGYDIPERTSMLMVSGTTGVTPIDNGELTIDNYYTLDGIRHEGKPTQKGVYIVNGKTIIIK